MAGAYRWRCADQQTLLATGAALAAAGRARGERLACGLLLLGPETLYPSHRHEAEELYISLLGSADWHQSDRGWVRQPPGAVLHHASFEPHAMRTDAQPLLALYLWRGTELK